MPFFSPVIYIRNFAGLCNRIEALNIAYAIQEIGGHQIVLDWPELDLLDVKATKQGPMPWLRRLIRLKPERIKNDLDLNTIARSQTVDLRIFYGSSQMLDTLYQRLPQSLSIKAIAAKQIQNLFHDRAKGSPVVGVHLRRGDFAGDQATVFDPDSHRHVAVPTWWYLEMMANYRRQYPGVQFFVSLNGHLDNFPELAGKRDVFTLNLKASNHIPPTQHTSNVHAVADLFALACCNVVLATPVSSFSHFAINVLGPPATAIIPVSGATVAKCSFTALKLQFQRLNNWNEACRKATRPNHLMELPPPAPAALDWLGSH